MESGPGAVDPHGTKRAPPLTRNARTSVTTLVSPDTPDGESTAVHSHLSWGEIVTHLDPNRELYHDTLNVTTAATEEKCMELCYKADWHKAGTALNLTTGESY